MTPADIERAVTALRRAFPHVADEGVERFRRELAPVPSPLVAKWLPDQEATAPGSLALYVGPAVMADVCPPQRGDRWYWRAYLEDDWPSDYAPTRDDAMRAAERSLGLPECEVVP